MVWWAKFQHFQIHIVPRRAGYDGKRISKSRTGPLIALVNRKVRKNFFETYKDKSP